MSLSNASPYIYSCKNFFATHLEAWDKIRVHPKLRNINLYNITHSLISPNPWEWMFAVQISLLIVTFLSLISRILSLMQTTKEVNPHPCIVPTVNMQSVTFFFFFFLCHLLNVGACTCHTIREGQVEWTTPTEAREERIPIPVSHATLFL